MPHKPQAQSHLLFRYIIAILVAVIAFLMAEVLRPLQDPAIIFPPFLLAVVFAAMYGGRGPGLLTALLSGAALLYWFLPPLDTSPVNLSRQLVFLITTLAAVPIAGTAYSQRWRTVDQARETERLRQVADAEAELADFFETASIGMHWIGEDGTILRTNQAELDLLGYERDEYIGHYITEFHVDLPVISDVLYRLRKGERLHQYPARLRCKDGRVKDVHIDSSAYFRDGRFIHTRGFTRDVTTEKHAQDAMVRLAAIVTSSSDAIIGKTLEGTITSWNGAAERIFGYTAAEMVGQSVFKLIPEELYDAERELLERLRHGEVVEFSEAERIRKDGERIWISLSVSPIRDRSGKITGAASIKRDVTERIRAEAERRQNQEQLRLAHQAARLGIWRWDIGSDVLRWDDGLCQLFGLQPDEAVTTYGDFIRRVHSEDQEKVNEAVQHALADSSELDHEFRIVLPDGEVRWLADLGQVTMDVSGEPPYLTGVCLDVTERKQMDDHMRRTQRLQAVGQLAGGLAHEANNQMTVVLGAAQFLLRRSDLNRSARDDIEQIQRAAERTASITAQLLAFSRQQILRIQHIDLNAVVHAMELVLRRALCETQSLVVRLCPGERFVRADPGQLEQALLNLTFNARDAMPNGGRLTIETFEVDIRGTEAPGHDGEIPAGLYTAIAVKDTGHGIDEPTLQRVFEPFFTTKEVGQGTGLGLAVVHGIVTQTGGYIRVDSMPNQGTTFTMYFPVVLSPDIDGPASNGIPPLLAAGKVALVVEDEAAVRAMTARSLADLGYTVLEASNGRAALELLRSYQDHLDIVITDIGMPEMDGHEFVRRLRDERPGLPVLFISGYGETPDVDQFLHKPFTPEALIQKVSEVLGAQHESHLASSPRTRP